MTTFYAYYIPESSPEGIGQSKGWIYFVSDAGMYIASPTFAPTLTSDPDKIPTYMARFHPNVRYERIQVG